MMILPMRMMMTTTTKTTMSDQEFLKDVVIVFSVVVGLYEPTLFEEIGQY